MNCKIEESTYGLSECFEVEGGLISTLTPKGRKQRLDEITTDLHAKLTEEAWRQTITSMRKLVGLDYFR